MIPARTFFSVLLITSLAAVPSASAQTQVSVDFSKPAYFPLLKGKASLFQEGLAEKPSLEVAMQPLDDLKIRAFRPLVNQGGDKLISYENGELSVTRDRSLTAFISETHKRQIVPILPLYQSPEDLRRADWKTRQEPPRDFNLYGRAMEEFVGLYEGTYPLMWEVWNEPQEKAYLDSDDTSRDYKQIYQNVAPAIRRADPDTLIVGPAVANSERVSGAFIETFVQDVKKDDLPLDYFSIHSYGRHKKALRKRKRGADDRNDFIIEKARMAMGTDFQTVPLVFTEYEYYPAGADVPWHYLRELTVGATKFLTDLEYFIEQTDIPFVTWNRYQHQGPNHRKGGLIDNKLRKRPIFHAFDFYGRMPTERKMLSLGKEGAKGLKGFASADAMGAGVLLWNESEEAASIDLSTTNLPFERGSVSMYRVDSNHGSYLEESSSDESIPVLVEHFQKGTLESQRLQIPGPGIVYFEILPESEPRQGAYLEASYIRSWQWAGRTENGITGDYGDFDWRTWTARVGVKGETGRGVAGVTMDNTPEVVSFVGQTFSMKASSDPNALLGIRVDYLVDRKAIKSVLLHGGTFDPRRSTELPWAREGATADKVIEIPELGGEHLATEFSFDAHAPQAWLRSEQRRTIVSFWMENTGAESQAVFRMLPGGVTASAERLEVGAPRDGNELRNGSVGRELLNEKNRTVLRPFPDVWHKNGG
ncbi:GH39 family glycosyl hydrolase [Pelagicoccus mobilis]|uniref:Cellulase family glycosylhydrolase n=1 Tax=Pelagicoccus mobilis TaxID=415221 RepID=A0A934RZY9_9BACT|nr:cellulase family glycosylhydrolase [Pelagicoccus mobilis]MBK1879761.1 cellulase family glycosylhydrolase [Pelagicoccus mobilis]